MVPPSGVVGALFALVIGPGAAGPVPHPGPPVYVEVDIGDDAVTFRFTGEQTTLNLWFGRPDTAPLFEAPMSEVDVAWAREVVRTLLVRDEPFTVAGAVADLTIESIEVPPEEMTGYGVPALSFTLRHAVEELPRQIGVVWKEWEGLAWYDAVKLPLVFRSFGEAQLVFLTPEEPSHLWHPESVVPREPPQVAPVAAPPAPQLPLPLVSLGVVAAILLAVPFLLRARVGAVVLLALIASAGLTAWLARGAAVVEVRNPFRPAVTTPAGPDAIALFEQLLRNVYAAFDARTEGEIYDLLAVSVAPELLGEMYGEVYESLILRGQGGAVCQVERIEVLEREADVDAEYEPWDIVPDGHEDDPFFKMRWKWRVHGVVSHWGHEHRRINSYEAVYTVRYGGTGWRIGACEILDQSRVDRDG